MVEIMVAYKNDLVSSLSINNSEDLHFVISSSDNGRIFTQIRIHESNDNYIGYNKQKGFLFSLDQLRCIENTLKKHKGVKKPNREA